MAISRESCSKSPGAIYVVATPIGNLADISQRAIDTLQAVDVIAAEDTRHSGILLKHWQISTRQVSLHAHNEAERGEVLLQQVLAGASLALISDAGTPLISDPGCYLLSRAHALGIRVIPIPGCCAAISALCAAGMPGERFIFEGFLPTKSGARQQRLTELVREPRTLIFYEAPHRIIACLMDMAAVFGGSREAVVARELTKTFETIRRAPFKELIPWVTEDPNQQKGEFVIVVAAAAPCDEAIDAMSRKILTHLLTELPLKQAVQLTASITGEKKNELYQLALLNQGGP